MVSIIRIAASIVIQRAWRKKQLSQKWWRKKRPTPNGKVKYFLLNTPSDDHQSTYIKVLKNRMRMRGIRMDIEIVPNLCSSVRSAFRAGFKRDTTKPSQYDAIVIGSHGCDCFMHSALCVEHRPNGASIIHSIEAFVQQLSVDVGNDPKPVFLDSCVSGKYEIRNNYPDIVEGHVDAPMLADAQSEVIEFSLAHTLGENFNI